MLEEHLTYQEVAERLGMRKAETEQSELERLRMENALLKKFHSELRELQLAQRNIGRSTTRKKNSK